MGPCDYIVTTLGRMGNRGVAALQEAGQGANRKAIISLANPLVGKLLLSYNILC